MSTEEGGGPARTEGPGGDFGMSYPGDGFEGLRGMPEAIGDVFGFGVVPFVVVRVRDEVRVDFASRGGTPLAEAQGNAAKGLAGADGWIRVGAVTDLFTTNCIILVIKLYSRTGDAIYVV